MGPVATGLCCPLCQSATRVINTSTDGNRVVRKRICKNDSCHNVVTTIEDPMGSPSPTPQQETSGQGLSCPHCGADTTVTQTRRAHGQVRRRRECQEHHTFKTKERPQL